MTNERSEARSMMTYPDRRSESTSVSSCWICASLPCCLGLLPPALLVHTKHQ